MIVYNNTDDTIVQNDTVMRSDYVSSGKRK